MNDNDKTFEVALLDRHVYAQGGYIKAGFAPDQTTTRHYKGLKVLVPKGDLPHFRPLTDGERDDYQNAINDATAKGEDVPPMPAGVASYDCAMLMHANEGTGMPMPEVYARGLHIYVHDPEYQSEDCSNLPGILAKLLRRPKMIEQRELSPAELTRYKGVALGLLLAVVDEKVEREEADVDSEAHARYGKQVQTIKANPDSGFVKVKGYLLTGKVGVADQKDINVYSQLYVFSEPGSDFVAASLDDEDRNSYREMSNGEFAPTQALTFPNSGMFVDLPGHSSTFATGDLRITAEPGSKVTPIEAWMPRQPFDHIGYTTYLGEMDGRPTPEQLEAAKSTVIGPVYEVPALQAA